MTGPPDPGFAKQLGAPKFMGVVMGLLSRKVRKQARQARRELLVPVHAGQRRPTARAGLPSTTPATSAHSSTTRSRSTRPSRRWRTSSRAAPTARSSSRSTDNCERRLLRRDGAEDRAARASAAAPICRSRDRPAATLQYAQRRRSGFAVMCFDDPSGPIWLLPLGRTARATWSRYRSSATSGSAHPARPRMPFPGHALDREPASGQSPRCTPGDSRHESAPPANYARRGQVGHRAVVGVPGAVSDAATPACAQTDDACIREVSGRVLRSGTVSTSHRSAALVCPTTDSTASFVRARPRTLAPALRLFASRPFATQPDRDSDFLATSWRSRAKDLSCLLRNRRSQVRILSGAC